MTAYDREIPSHIRERLINRKTHYLIESLNTFQNGNGHFKVGVDLGCGYGWYQQHIMSVKPDVKITGIDLSWYQLRNGRKWHTERGFNSVVDLVQADILSLPVHSESVDFAYSINLFHHIRTESLQRAAFEEVYRVLRPGGLFILHEINVENPVFRAYMGYIFPLIRRIDDGTEIWLTSRKLSQYISHSRLELLDVKYFTFLPDFTPEVIVRWLGWFEMFLEKSRWRHWSAHYAAVFKRT